MDYDAELKALVRASRRLDEGQGAQARRNARTVVLAALRRCRKALDETYPTERRKPKRTGRLSKAGYTRRLRAQGYEHVPWPADVTIHSFCRIHGIKTVKHRYDGTFWAPSWILKVRRLSLPDATIQRMKASPTFREAIVAEALLMEKD